MTHKNFLELPFSDLFTIVFTDDGHVKACGRAACLAMMKRLEGISGEKEGTLGDRRTGRLYLPEAYERAKALVRK